MAATRAFDSEAIENETSPPSPRPGGAKDLEELLLQSGAGDAGLPLRDWVDLAEAWYITQALRRCGGNRSATARALGIGRRTLYAKMDKLGIEPTWSASVVRTAPGPRTGSPGEASTPGEATADDDPRTRAFARIGLRP